MWPAWEITLAAVLLLFSSHKPHPWAELREVPVRASTEPKPSSCTCSGALGSHCCISRKPSLYAKWHLYTHLSWHCQELPPKCWHKHSTPAQGHQIKQIQLPFWNPGSWHQNHPARLVSWLFHSSASQSGFPASSPSELERWPITMTELHGDMMKSPARLLLTSGKL